MARVKGEAYKPTRKEKAAKRMKIVMYIFILATALNCGRMIFGAARGIMTKSQITEQFGGAEKMAELSKAEFQEPYYTYVTERVDKARTPVGWIFSRLDFLGCFMLLWKTCRLGWGVKGTVGFTLALFYELLFALVCFPLYFRWKKIAEKKEEKKPMVDVQKEMNQKLEEEQQKMEREAKIAEQKAKDEAWQAEYEAIMRQKRVAEWGNRDGGNGKR